MYIFNFKIDFKIDKAAQFIVTLICVQHEHTINLKECMHAVLQSNFCASKYVSAPSLPSSQNKIKYKLVTKHTTKQPQGSPIQMSCNVGEKSQVFSQFLKVLSYIGGGGEINCSKKQSNHRKGALPLKRWNLEYVFTVGACEVGRCFGE